MQSTKIFYGDVFLDNESLKDRDNKYPMELEYYKVCSRLEDSLNENSQIYGVEIVKKEYKGKNICTEKACIDKITYDEKLLNKLICKLKDNAVTPITLNDVINDIFYE